jgi:hypothetical protein
MRYLEFADEEDLVGVDQWKLDLLKVNPEYCSWGPNEDYMIKKEGWGAGQFFDSWNDFGPWRLDDYNECVNFYFEVDEGTKEISLTLWWLHPRKGCSRGILIQKIEQMEVFAIQGFLKDAAKRNADRFGKFLAMETSKA